MSLPPIAEFFWICLVIEKKNIWKYQKQNFAIFIKDIIGTTAFFEWMFENLLIKTRSHHVFNCECEKPKIEKM